MRTLQSLQASAVVCAFLSAGLCTLPLPAQSEEWVGRSVTIGGRKVACNNAEIMIDRSLPSEGGAGDDFVILNPEMLNSQPKTVRIFVFTHECGHLTVGDSELKADCYAVDRGVRERWLDRKGLDEVCRSFDGAPETDTHPSAARRCKNLDQCYGRAVATYAAAPPPVPPAPTPAVKPATEAARATEAAKPVAASNLARAAAPRKAAISAWRCTDPLQVRASAADPIGHLIDEDAKVAANCR
jgi:hypothetical protein